jgi:biotin carboxylase
VLIDLKEIAIRVFRTAHELAMHTVAIYSYEDRLSAHRQKVRAPQFVSWHSSIAYTPRRMKRTVLERVSPPSVPTSLRTILFASRSSTALT